MTDFDQRNQHIDIQNNAEAIYIIDNIHLIPQKLSNLSIQRLDKTERRVDDVEDGLVNVREQVRQLIHEQDVNVYAPSPPMLNIPLLSDYISRREQVVQTLKRLVTTRIWTAVYGGAGTGKTHLIILLTQELGTCKAWVRLGPDYTIEQACIQLDAACAALLNESIPKDRVGWYERLAKCLGRHSFIVLDDLPQLSGKDGLSERLRLLIHAFQSQGIHLVSTSSYQLPSTLRNTLRTLHAWSIPLFSQQEAADILQSYGAPDDILAQAKFVNTLAQRHPQFIVSIAHYLALHDWQLDKQMSIELFLEKHIVDLKDEVQQRLLATIEDGDSRELLYRLCLILDAFSFDEVRTVAAVNPEITRSSENLAKLTGPWVEREQPELYHISPLTRAVGTNNLSVQTKKACNYALAELMLTKKMLHITQAVSVLHYFLNAEEYNRAGLFIISILLDIQDQEQTVENYGFVSQWTHEPLPEQMDLGIRIYLRGVQFTTQSKRGEQTAFIEKDLAGLMTQISANEVWAVLAVYKISSQITIPYIQVLRLWSQAHLPDGKSLVSLFPKDIHPESLIWVSVQDIETIEQMNSWIEVVEQLTEEQRHYAFHEIYAEDGCMYLVNRVWEHEAEKPKEQQHWEEVLSAFHDIARRASYLHLELLWACATRASIIVLAEYRENLSEAFAITEQSLTQATDDPRVHFLLKECIGRQYLYAGNEESAIFWLQQAIDQSTFSYPFTHMIVLLSLSRATGSNDPLLAVQNAQQAVQLAATLPQIANIELVKALGELAIAQWLTGDQSGTFDTWDQAGEQLLACREETDYWKGLFVLYGHISSYFMSITQTGKPPVAMQIDQPYVAPGRGFFLTPHAIRAHLYKQANDSFLMVLLADFATAVGRNERALIWAQRGLELSRLDEVPFVYYQLSTMTLPHLIIEKRYNEAFDVALEIGMISVALREKRKRGGKIIEKGLDIPLLLGVKPSEQWMHAEYQAAQRTLFPLMFSLGNLELQEANDAQKQAAEIIAYCREISVSAVDKTLWAEAADIFEQTFIRRVPSEQLRRKSNALDSQQYNILHYLGYLGASLQRDLPLHDAWHAHDIVLSYVEKTVTPPLSIMYQRVFSPFFTDYWIKKFKQQRSSFQVPTMVEIEIKKAQDMSGSGRARAILKAIAYGLNIQ